MFFSWAVFAFGVRAEALQTGVEKVLHFLCERAVSDRLKGHCRADRALDDPLVAFLSDRSNIASR